MIKTFLFTFLFATSAFAGGTIAVTPQIYKSGEMGGMVGLSVYQKIAGPVAFNSWIGTGDHPESEYSKYLKWASAKAGLDLNVGKAIVGIGYQMNAAPEELFTSKADELVYTKIAYKIW